MQTTTLDSLTVGRLCLGTMLMGGATPAEAHRMLDRFLEAGGTLIDTADVYGDVRFAVSDREARDWPGPNPSRLRRERPPPRRGRDRPISGACTRPS